MSVVKTQFTIPEQILWGLKKISCEKRAKITNVVIEALRDYIDKNHALLEQKIVMVSEAKTKEAEIMFQSIAT